MNPPESLKALSDEEHFCQCGCGIEVGIFRKTNRIYGQIRGQPKRFAVGHFSKTQRFRDVMAAVDPEKTKHVGEANGQWIGGRYVGSNGYICIRIGPNDVRSEHRVIAERKIGRSLLPEEVVHHIDGNRQNNDPSNLQVLPSHAEHMKIHAQQRKLAALQAISHE